MTAPISDYRLAQIRRKLGENIPLPPKPRKQSNEESRMQQSLISWFDVMAKSFGVPAFLLYSVPNGAKRDAITGAILKREGARAGAPDLLLDVARGNHHGARIEMKRPDGNCTPAQREFHAALVAQGYRVRVCYSVREAIEFVTEYLRGSE